MSRTATRPRKAKPRRVLLSEQVQFSAPLRVDRDQGIIYGVKVLGLESRNGRRYTLEAVRKALPLYEGIAVNCDHPKTKPTESRSSYDRFGWLENVRAKDDGLYADLHMLKSHPMAERIMEAAEKNPDLFGLSHNAEGDTTRDQDGVDVVTEISEVRHVDLVADPATTKSLSESIKMKTIQQVLEARFPNGKAAIKALFEQDDMPPLDMPAPPPAAEGDFKSDLVAAIGKLVQSEDPADHDLAKKIMAMLKPAGTVSELVPEQDEEKKDDEKNDEEKKIESLDRELKALKREKQLRELCEAEGVSLKGKEGKELLEALLDTANDARVKWLLDREKKLQAAVGRSGPRSNSAHQLSESWANGKRTAIDLDTFIAAIKN